MTNDVFYLSAWMKELQAIGALLYPLARFHKPSLFSFSIMQPQSTVTIAPIYELARSLYHTFPSSNEYSDQLAAAIQGWRSDAAGMGLLPRLEPVVKMSQERASLWPALVNMVQQVQQDPKTTLLFASIMESMPLVAAVERALEGDDDDDAVIRFIDSLCLDQPQVQHDQVMTSIQNYLDTLDHMKRQAVSQVLNQQRYQAMEGMYHLNAAYGSCWIRY